MIEIPNLHGANQKLKRLQMISAASLALQNDVVLDPAIAFPLDWFQALVSRRSHAHGRMRPDWNKLSHMMINRGVRIVIALADSHHHHLVLGAYVRDHRQYCYPVSELSDIRDLVSAPAIHDPADADSVTTVATIHDGDHVAPRRRRPIPSAVLGCQYVPPSRIVLPIPIETLELPKNVLNALSSRSDEMRTWSTHKAYALAFAQWIVASTVQDASALPIPLRDLHAACPYETPPGCGYAPNVLHAVGLQTTTLNTKHPRIPAIASRRFVASSIPQVGVPTHHEVMRLTA